MCSLIVPGESISKKEPSKIPEKKTMRLYIVPGAPILLYQQGNNNQCILSSLVSALHYMGDRYASEYIIRRKQKSLVGIQNKGQMHFCRNYFYGTPQEKNEKSSIILLRNGIHPHHMIYFRISLLIQLGVFYQTRGTRTIIVLKFAVNGYLIPILRWCFHSHRIA